MADELTRSAIRAGCENTARAVANARHIADVCADSSLAAQLLADAAHAADPDVALTQLCHLCETHPHVMGEVLADAAARRVIMRVAGTSRALIPIALRHPQVLSYTRAPERGWNIPPILDSSDTGALRADYYRRLWGIAAADCAADSIESFPDVSAALADLVVAALRAALELAQRQAAAPAALVLVAMGKTGGRELNYISDVDLIPVAAGEDTDTAAALMKAVTAICSTSTEGSEPPLWPIDTNLRPEGRDGPLVKTMSAHVSYYRRWAHTWEFQALLKARVIAGDDAAAAEYSEKIAPLAYGAVERENFVADTQAMRTRVERSVPARERERHIKLGVGGLRDVEFTVQLLQMVHGRTDASLRVPGTMGAISALCEGGYISRDHAAELTECYSWLRTLEHRVQLWNLRRSHTLPTKPTDLRRLSRAMHTADVMATWEQVRRRVRALHEDMFYRPLLPATAQLSAADISLEPKAAHDRLTAIGYRDARAALGHIEALTRGLSRRAAIQRHLLPVMLQWFAAGPDPDDALLAFRRLSETLGGAHWYLKLLRDDNSVAAQLAAALASSRYIGHEVTAVPEAVTWLADSRQLEPRSIEELTTEAEAIFARHQSATTRVRALRVIRRREMMRAALADVTQGISTRRQRALSAVTDLTVRYAMRAARRDYETEYGQECSARLHIIAMGRSGGEELTYGSDFDCVVLASGEGDILTQAQWVTQRWRALLADATDVPALPVDMALRPEGKAGPIVRSVDSYIDYLTSQASPWERHALIRARLLADGQEREDEIIRTIDQVRYGAGLSNRELKEIRRLKARMESERLPRGVHRSRHVKLGPGGLSDVEWAVQIAQLRYGTEFPQLRTPQTLTALEALTQADLVSAADAEVLAQAWRTANHIRAASAIGLRKIGSAMDLIPTESRERSIMGRLINPRLRLAGDFDEEWAKRSRRARAVAERLIYGTEPGVHN